METPGGAANDLVPYTMITNCIYMVTPEGGGGCIYMVMHVYCVRINPSVGNKIRILNASEL